MRMKWLAILALGCAWPAAAQEAPASPDYRAMSDAELGELLEAIDTEGLSDPCTRKVPLLAEFVRRNPDNAVARSWSLTAQSFCAYEEERHADGLALLKQAESVAEGPKFPGLGLYFAGQLEDGAETLARLRSIAGFGELDGLPPQVIFAAFRTIRRSGLRDELNAFGFELAATADFADLDPDLQDSFATGALRHAAKIGDSSRVEELLAHTLNPTAMLELLSDKAAEPLWPQIEAHAGENLANISDPFVRVTAERLADKPEDRDRLSRYAHALLFAGRFQEAVDVARNWRAERSDPTTLEEGDAWSLNIEAYALDALGRTAEADAVFDGLAALPAEEFPWLVNFVINRASRLVGQERWQEGLAATELARTVAETQGTTYAKLLVARDRACALQRLGRTAEAESEAEFLVAQFKEYAPGATTGLMCLGRTTEAERLLAAALAEEVSRVAVLDAMQDERFELFYTPSALPRVRDLILANDGLREQVLAHVRVLPERFVPISYVRREQLAQRVAR